MRMIRVMEPDLVAQIKAGEVIERPASVVKELVENALDAGARRIRIEIGEGGTRLIRVIDDGLGIQDDQLPLAFAEHTSSKLQSSGELDRIETLGFRGEALYAISNVSRVEAVSGLRGTATAASISIDNGRLVSRGPAAPGGGTRIAVHDLFASVPARRKHLRTNRAESAAVHTVAAQYAIGHPHVAVLLAHDGRSTLNAPGTGRMEDAFASVYGADLVDKMVPVSAEGQVQVNGLISPPGVSRSNRSAILIFVNGRPVRSLALIFAIEDAYSGLLMAGRHPLAALNITLPADQVDPNVHPTKLEVRFLADRAVFGAVRGAVVEALSGRDPAVQPVASFESWGDAGEPALGILPPDPPRRPYPEGLAFEERAVPGPVPTFTAALPALRVFGQASLSFIVAEGPSGLYMIDQHAAHERILFDILANRSAPRQAQPLLQPSHLEPTAAQWSALEDHWNEIKRLGFEVEEFGDRSCRVRAVPLAANRTVGPEVLLDVLDALAGARSTEEIVDSALTIVACKAAVKAGQSLAMQEMRELVSRLEKTENPRTCPHGRPTTIHLSRERLEREFGRR